MSQAALSSCHKVPLILLLILGAVGRSTASPQVASSDAIEASQLTASDKTDAPLRPTLPDDARNRVEELEAQISALREQARYGEAIPLAEKVLAIREQYQPFWSTPDGRKEWWETADAKRRLTLVRLTSSLPTEAQSDLAKAEAAGAEVRRLFAQADYQAALAAVEQSLSVFTRWLGAEHPETIIPLMWAANLHSTLDHSSDAELADRRALLLAQRELGEQHPLTLSIAGHLAQVLKAQGRFKDAEPLFTQCLEGRLSVLGDEHVDTLNALEWTALLSEEAGRLHDAADVFARTVETRRRVQGEDHPHTQNAMCWLARVLESAGEYAAARAVTSQRLCVLERLHGDDQPQTLGVVSNLARLLLHEGKLDEAETAFRRALEGRRRRLGTEHVDTLVSLNNLACLYRAQGKLADSEATFRDVLQRQLRVLGERHVETLRSMNSLAAVLHLQGRSTEARELFDRSLRLRRAVLGDEHPDTLISLNDMASCLEAGGDLAEAERLHRASLELGRRLRGEEHLYTLISENNLAHVLWKSGRGEEAEDLLTQVLDRGQQALGAEHPDIVVWMNNLADIQTAQGKLRDAALHYRDALDSAEIQRVRIMGDERDYAVYAGKLGLSRIGASYAAVLVRLQDVHRAIAVIERSRGRVMLELLARSEQDLIAARRSARRNPARADRATAFQFVAAQKDAPTVRLVAFQESAVGSDSPAAEKPTRPTLPADASKQIDDLQHQIDQLRREGRYADAVPFAEQILAIRKKHQPFWDGPAGRDEWWETADAQRLVDTVRTIAALPAPAQNELSDADRATDKVHALFEQGQYGEAAALAARALDLRRKHLGGTHALVAESLNDLAEPLREQGAYDKAEPLYREALTVLRSAVAPEHPLTATVTNNIAVVLHQRGEASDQAEAERLYKESLAVRRRLHGDKHKDVAESLTNLADLLRRKGEFRAAEPLVREAAATFRELLGDDAVYTSVAENNLGSLYQVMGQYDRAEPLLRKSLETFRKRLGDEHPYVATCMNNLGYFLDGRGEHEAAEQIFRDALALRRKALGHEHELVIETLNNLAGALVAGAKYIEAETTYRQALAMCRRLWSGPHATTARTLNDLAGLLEEQGDLHAAEPLYREAIAMFRSAHGEDHPELATVMNNLALLLELEGEPSEAEQLHRDSLQIRRNRLGNDHPATGLSLNNLAMLLRSKGELAAAEPLMREALQVVQRSLGEEHPQFALTLNNLASLHFSQGDYAAAESEYRRSLEIRRRALGREHPETLIGQKNLGAALAAQGDDAAAAKEYEEAMKLAESLRTRIIGSERERDLHAGRLSLGQIGASYAGVLLRLDRSGPAFSVLERARSRALLDLLGRSDRDLTSHARGEAERANAAAPLEELLAREKEARARTVEAETRLAKIRERTDLEAAEKSRLEAEQTEVMKRARQEQADAERAVLAELRKVWPDAKPLDTESILAGLETGERLLCYSWSPDAVLLLIAGPKERGGSDATVRGVFLAEGKEAVNELTAIVARVQAAVVKRPSGAGEMSELNRAAADLLDRLIPGAVRDECTAARRLVVLPDGPLNALPLDALLAAAESEAPREGIRQEIAYAPSATVYLNRREAARENKRDESPLAAVVVGDPLFKRARTEPQYPAQGLVALRVLEDGNAAQAGLTRGDVVLSYGGQKVDKLEELTTLRDSMDRAIQAGERSADEPVPVEFWRRGELVKAALKPGKLGVEFDSRSPSEALKYLAMLTRGAGEAVAEVSATDQIRLFGGSLPPLAGTRREAEQVARLIQAAGGKCLTLVGEEAAVAKLEDGALGKRILHIATHGLTGSAERPYDAAIALTQPETPTPDDIGFLRLDDLIRRWRGRLKGCDLVVLSACDTQRGVKVGDSIMALPWGFFYAGAPTVIASLWKVDDTATALLMIRLYENLLGRFSETRGGFSAGKAMPKAAALAEAKRWLRSLTAKDMESLIQRHGLAAPALASRGEPVPAGAPDLTSRPFEHPYYWAAFVLIGDPE